jgi:hypothetical protein
MCLRKGGSDGFNNVRQRVTREQCVVQTLLSYSSSHLLTSQLPAAERFAAAKYERYGSPRSAHRGRLRGPRSASASAREASIPMGRRRIRLEGRPGRRPQSAAQDRGRGRPGAVPLGGGFPRVRCHGPPAPPARTRGSGTRRSPRIRSEAASPAERVPRRRARGGGVCEERAAVLRDIRAVGRADRGRIHGRGAPGWRQPLES